MSLVCTKLLRSKPLRACVLGALTLVASLAVSAQAVITTVAGGKASDPGVRSLNACFPIQVAAPHGSDVYVVSCDRIYKVSGGVWTAVAGTGEVGFSGDGGPALNAMLGQPHGMSVDGSGNIFIVDGSRIREVDAATMHINTVAGTGTAGYNGDGRPATSAQIGAGGGLRNSVFADGSGNIFIADGFNHRVRKFTVGGDIQTIAGTGTANTGSFTNGIDPLTAQINAPSAVFVDGSNNIFIADGSRIWEIVAGLIQTVAGGNGVGYSGDGGLATSAQIFNPHGLFADGSNVYIADTGNNVIREFTVGGNIQTVAGNGANQGVGLGGFPDGFGGFIGDGGPATSAELNSPHEVFTDASHNIFIAEDFFGVREVDFATKNIQTFIANGALGFSGDGGPATGAQLSNPLGAVADSFGNIFLVDATNNVVQEIVAATGVIQTVAGNFGLGFGYSGDNGPATSAQLNGPNGLFEDGFGHIFIADSGNSVIREFTVGGNITTVAGNSGFGYSGDNGPATSAQLNGPAGVFVDSFGSIFIADFGNNVIRRVDAVTKKITTVAGNGGILDINGIPVAGYSGDNGPATSAQLNLPNGVFVDGSGNIFIADGSNNAIREVVAASGNIQTVAGTGIAGYSGDGGPATSAQLRVPADVFGDALGNLFVAEFNNHTIRKFTVGGNIQTVAGTGFEGFTGDGGPATLAELDQPQGIFVEPNGSLVIADSSNGRIRIAAPPAVATQTLIATLPGLGLSAGNSNALSVKLQAAIASIAGGNNALAISELQAFINQVNALLRSGRLAAGQAAALTATAQGIIQSL